MESLWGPCDSGHQAYGDTIGSKQVVGSKQAVGSKQVEDAKMERHFLPNQHRMHGNRNRSQHRANQHRANWCYLFTVFIAATAFCFSQNTSATEFETTSLKRFRAGAVTVDITPTSERSIVAGGFLEAQSSKIHDRLFVRSIVLDDGATTIALTVVDTCMMTQALIDDAKQRASKQCGIPVDKMMVSATHTHSAPSAMACLGTRLDKGYAEWLPGKIAEAIVAAHAKLEPARIGWGSIDDWEHTHNRRWIRKPENKVVDPFGQATGLAHMHPGYQSKDVIGPSGPVDPELSIVSLQSLAGRPLAVLANYSQHYFGAQAISSDYYGLFCKHVARLLNEPGEGNGPFVCAMSQGTSGDLMWMDYGSPAKSLTIDAYAESVARYAEKALDAMQYHDFAPLSMVEKNLALKYRVPDEDRLAWARPIASRIENGLAKNVQEVYANEALILHERQSTKLKLQAIQIGDLTIATLPNEVYALTGLKLKGRSPSPSSFNIELANGAEGYIPPPEQHALGGYTTWPARTAGLEVAAEPQIVGALVDALEEVTGKKQRTMNEEHGPYALAILQAKPSSYWRLNDADGFSARNAVSSGKPARLSPGFAWFLPGVGSGTGIGSHEELRPSSFSGVNQINRAVHMAGGELTCELETVGSSYSVAFWFWLGESSGASDRGGTLFLGPASEKLVARQSKDHLFQLDLNGMTSADKWPADLWHFVTLVRDGGVCKLYLDDLIEPVVQTHISPIDLTRKIGFGSALQGKLDEIAVFDHALSPTEINSLWKVSGIEQQRERDTAQRKRHNEDASAKSKAPEFPNNYGQAIADLKPVVLESLAASPVGMTNSGAVTFQADSYAAFRSGRIAFSTEKLSSTYSVSLWFLNQLPNEARPVTAYLFSRGPDTDEKAPGDHFGIGGTYQSDLTAKLMLFNGNARNQAVSGRTTIPPQTWNHFVAIRNKSHVRVFLNGEPTPELDADIEDTTRGSREFFLGARSDQFAPLQGQLAYFALFDRELTSDEAKLLHTASGQKTGTPKAPPIQQTNPTSRPLSPEKSLGKIHVPPGFRVELAASEPQVIDPVAFDWDASGRLWVVEMSDYPLGMDGQGKPGGRVRILEDRDGDGRYEHSTLFAEGLNFPNGILTWRDGVLITAAPQILFLRDTDGDSKADTSEVLFEGFNEGNQQLRMNGLRWGLDNWVYCANGGHHANHGLGTKVSSRRNGQTYEIGSRDFRIEPDTGALVIESGPSQFGRNRDAWGHWFGTQNAKPLWNYVIADRYLARNPFVPAPSPIQFVLPPNSPEVFPASRPEKRFHSFQEAGHFTSACGGMVYGDQRLFGEDGKLHAFTCEPFHNLVQHNVVIDSGVSFTSTRPTGEGRFDFFASEDRWCRPVMVRTGPDGALWVADMYRYMIEHPQWLPPEGKQELLPHYRLGDDRGRIYRVVRSDAKTSSPWNLTSSKTESLVAALDTSNDWQRDKAQQLLVWAKDSSAIPLLEELVRTCQRPQTRLQALATLDGLGGLSKAMIVAGLQDTHPRVRENALLLAERHRSDEVVFAAVKMTRDPDDKVCLQLALTLGEWPDERAGSALVELAQRYYEEPFIKSAIMSSALTHAKEFAAGMAKSEPVVMSAFREPIVRQSVGRKDYTVIRLLLADALSNKDPDRVVKLDELLHTFQQVGTDIDELSSITEQNGFATERKQVDEVMAAMVVASKNERLELATRIASAQLLCRTNQHRALGIKILSQWLTPQIAPDSQHRILQTFAQCGHESIPDVLTTVWPEFSPELRIRAIDVWLSRAAWTNDLLNRIENGQISVGSLDLSQKDRLIRYPNGSIAERSKLLLQDARMSSRKQIVDRYRGALETKGDIASGNLVYLRVCASCHRRETAGYEVGPNLATVVNHSSEKLLINILDPNADIQPGYQAYNVLLESDEVLSGLLTGETANSITIKQANGATRTISRLEVEKLRNSNLSFMPEGMEAVLSQKDVADLIAFLQDPIPVNQLP